MFDRYSARVKSDDGVYSGRVWFFNVITERKRAEERIRFLAEASALLASSLDYERTFESLAALVVPELADWCFVDLVEPDGSFRRLAVGYADPAKADVAAGFWRRYAPIPEGRTGSRG